MIPATARLKAEGVIWHNPVAATLMITDKDNRRNKRIRTFTLALLRRSQGTNIFKIRVFETALTKLEFIRIRNMRNGQNIQNIHVNNHAGHAQQVDREDLGRVAEQQQEDLVQPGGSCGADNTEPNRHNHAGGHGPDRHGHGVGGLGPPAGGDPEGDRPADRGGGDNRRNTHTNIDNLTDVVDHAAVVHEGDGGGRDDLIDGDRLEVGISDKLYTRQGAGGKTGDKKVHTVQDYDKKVHTVQDYDKNRANEAYKRPNIADVVGHVADGRDPVEGAHQPAVGGISDIVHTVVQIDENVHTEQIDYECEFEFGDGQTAKLHNIHGATRVRRLGGHWGFPPLYPKI